MNAQIDKDGFLWIERAGKMKQQMCPYAGKTNDVQIQLEACGDWCPLFDDSGTTYIDLCIGKELHLVADERSK